MPPILTACVTSNFALERVTCMSWYFAGENLDPCFLAHVSALWCAHSRFRQICSTDVLLVKKQTSSIHPVVCISLLPLLR
ncbi:uncharacterized protein EURHEDRAFT_279320 [Aspergillus ruber CBS 135680]|uniref:Uncharacterized protein n=1 Tax=Aspergillus ruber (strain CBS 135680) TaxID=1388766 RepID=A0A017S193_ASPRC|nr:uncharacterized protein EURHEDRAFT_279320 [Aspergillus ruber CBS 135680]EYE90823.1 hypothetical protein EURHEDRAFT_279320 [Aspergillus ruber CBS 135680]